MRGPSVATSRSRTLAVPAVAGERPSRILISVDLPAPFAPTRPTTPGGTSTVSCARAVIRPPYCLVSPFVTIRDICVTLARFGRHPDQGNTLGRLRVVPSGCVAAYLAVRNHVVVLRVMGYPLAQERAAQQGCQATTAYVVERPPGE